MWNEPLDVDELDRDELLELVAEMRRDWYRLNDLFNRTADRYHWCCSYERRLAAYNMVFERPRLLPRPEAGHFRDPYPLPELGDTAAGCEHPQPPVMRKRGRVP